MTGDTASLRRALAAKIGGSSLKDPAWRAAVGSVPRELFLGAGLFRPNGSLWEPVRRATVGEEEWHRLAYADTTWVTQVEGVDATEAVGPLTGRPTSSSTLPSLVVRTLEVAGIHDGDKVLEIGTGTGYSTAVICHRLGDANVTSVEYDSRLAESAAASLRTAGYAPTLVTGDGLHGYREGAEYDAVVATCAVRHIPRSWLWQLRDGGTITAPLSGWMVASGLIRLTLGDDGVAQGRFSGDRVSYMLARPHERPPRPTFYPLPGEARRSRVNPGLLQDWTAHFVAQLAAPSAELVMSGEEVILVDVATGSQAWTEPAGDGWSVHQDGPLRLWDQVEDALATWQTVGSPDQTAFGMTVTDETQRVWLGDPAGPSWRLPT
ncbi:SAM-dependent methyltransferase [Streptomyces hygroscopicus subsp. sporocinereus]|uniref:Protein-L-isoaspartate O-methyltransferase n=1 Tax=Streptomyces hygroscopicus TaxID=1912 RepID=A0ABQ3TXP8_STRHY|nr:ATP-grasp peptide maturase system methyltransferase [Streptomyces hygroscopicus]GHJ28136.1 SAM-dependent methyltransferase [Streptomyces hygroscopicus]